MKKLLILLFIVSTFPARAVVIDTVICMDHINRTATVHHRVGVPAPVASLPRAVITDYACRKIESRKNRRLYAKGN